MIRLIQSELNLFLALLVVRYSLAFWIFGDFYTRIHDNMDSDVVYSVAAGRFWANGFDAEVFDVFIAGNAQWYHYTQSFSPQTLAYAIFPTRWAYLFNELFGLFLAFAGMRLLLWRLGVSLAAARIFSAFFAISMAFTTYGLGLIGAPLLIWFALGRHRVTVSVILVAFLIGLATNLALHGIFVPFVFLILVAMTRTSFDWRRAAGVMGAFLMGSLIELSGIIYALIFDTFSHRSEWDISPVILEPVKLFWSVLEDVSLLDNSYSAIYLPGFFSAFFLIAGFLSKMWRPSAWVAGTLVVSALLLQFLPVYEPYLPGPLASVQFHRLGLFSVLFLCVLAAMVVSSSASRIGRILVWCGVWLYVPVAILQAAGVNEDTLFDTVDPGLRLRGEQVLAERDFARLFSSEFFGGDGVSRQSMRQAERTFAAHFRPDIYGCFRSNLPQGSRVLSLGLDPMIAPMNGISSVDGYHNFYPLEYKHEFRSVIARQIEGDDRNEWYFDDWGSRLISFVTSPDDIRISLAAADDIGVTHLISRWDLAGSSIANEIEEQATNCSQPDGPWLYRIVL